LPADGIVGRATWEALLRWVLSVECWLMTDDWWLMTDD
jgi:hypothetical protein